MSGTLLHIAIADKIYDILHRMQCMRKKIIKEEIKSIPICVMIYTHMVMAIRK